MRVNLFRFGHDRKDVYESLGRDYQRDRLTLLVVDLIAVGAVITAVRDLDRLTGIAIVVAYWAASAGIRMFVDQSNRNWHMHRLDWDANEQQ